MFLIICPRWEDLRQQIFRWTSFTVPMEMDILLMGQGAPWVTLFTHRTQTGPEESTWTQRRTGLSDSQVRDLIPPYLILFT